MNFVIQGSSIVPAQQHLTCEETLSDVNLENEDCPSTSDGKGRTTRIRKKGTITQYSDEELHDSGDSYIPEDSSGETTESYMSDSDRFKVTAEAKRKVSQTSTVQQETSSALKKRAKSGLSQKEHWKRNENQVLRRQGQAYLGKKKDKDGKCIQIPRSPRKMGSVCTSRLCAKSGKRHCSEIQEADRQNIFDTFWTTMDWGQRKTYVASLVGHAHTRTSTLGQTEGRQSRRQGSFIFNLRVNSERKQVCKKTFLNTLGLKEWSVRHWVLQSKPDHGMHQSKYTSPPAKRDSSKTDIAREFLESLPKLPSHYCRKDSNKLYLETTVESKTQLFKLFQEYCDSKGLNRISRPVLFQTFKSMNLGIYRPKKDECNVCCSYKYGLVSQTDYEAHTLRKREGQEEKKTDKRTAEDHSDVCVLTMDLQVVLLAPRLLANANYYKTKLACHNFTIYNLATKDVQCYFWHECNGEVASNNFATCVWDHLNFLVQNNPTPLGTIILYSDGCNYQNRNATMSNCLLHFSIHTGITVIQKYLEKGHTFMEVDSVHSVIERKLRNRQIYWPAEYEQVFISARSHPRPYNVKHVDFTFFRDFSKLTYYRSIRPGSAAGDPQVVDIRAMRCTPNGVISFKLMHSDPWQPLPRRPAKVVNAEIPPLYRQPRPIKSTKYTHLQQLKEVLPQDYHRFYDSLPHEPR